MISILIPLVYLKLFIPCFEWMFSSLCEIKFTSNWTSYRNWILGWNIKNQNSLLSKQARINIIKPKKNIIKFNKYYIETGHISILLYSETEPTSKLYWNRLWSQPNHDGIEWYYDVSVRSRSKRNLFGWKTNFVYHFIVMKLCTLYMWVWNKWINSESFRAHSPSINS